MSVFAIATKELSAVQRRGWTYLVRAVYVVVLAVMVSGVTSQVSWRDSAAVGRDIFLMLVTGQFIVTVTLCALLTGDSIAAERHSRSLSLLVVSSFRPVHIVLGKIVACLAAAGTTVAATVPLLMVTVLYGGVSAQEVVVAGVCLLATLVAGTTLGVGLSASTRSGVSAGGLTLAVLVLWLWVTPGWLGTRPLGFTAQIVSPWHCVKLAMSIGTGSALPLSPVLSAAGIITLLSLYAAVCSVRHNCEDTRPRSAASRRLESRFRRPWGCSLLFWETSGLSGSVWAFAIQAYQLLAILIAVAGIHGIATHSAHGLNACTKIAGALLGGVTVATIMLCIQAMIRQKADGSLGILFATPIGPDRYVIEYLAGCARVLLPALLAFELVVCFQWTRPSSHWGDWVGLLDVCGVHAVCMLTWAVFYWLVALKAGASCRSHIGAVLNTLMYVLGTGPCVAIGLASIEWPHGTIFTVLGSIFAGLGITVLFPKLTIKIRSWHHKV